MSTITIHPYRPGVIGEMVTHHATYYERHWNFDVRFETQVARELSLFVEEFNPEQDGLWWAAQDDVFAGAVAVDGSRSGSGKARLRWFIVPEAMQGAGVGGRLFDEAMAFCREKAFGEVYLWTFDGLTAARTLYERAGFRLTEEQQGAPWGPEITEQKFVLRS